MLTLVLKKLLTLPKLRGKQEQKDRSSSTRDSKSSKGSVLKQFSVEECIENIYYTLTFKDNLTPMICILDKELEIFEFIFDKGQSRRVSQLNLFKTENVQVYKNIGFYIGFLCSGFFSDS